ncbi:hypothetical protein KJE20_02549 [Pyrenophora tritici-repentis]|uniref:Uncharacterized protein n=1 Tax=Pyrenophora tritici-repentis TaxID=45151 RepID=A0A922NKX5_9PLEO|nr:hypothetical protein Ptr86124_003106 [Pyrenophora tritici-repentis]KAI1689371.1 hypothetical protein KJE20_02549 [Pyrenophora tritici-repentis]
MAPLKQAETLSDANLRRHLLLITLPCKEILCKARHKVRSPNLLVVLPNFKEVLNLITIMAFLKQAKPLSDANPRRHLLPPPLLHNETLSNAMHLLKYLNNDMLSNASHLVKSLRFQPPNSVQAKLGPLQTRLVIVQRTTLAAITNLMSLLVVVRNIVASSASLAPMPLRKAGPTSRAVLARM